MRKVVLNTLTDEKRAAVLEEGKVVEWLYEQGNQIGRTGNIIIGKVTDIVPGMDAAFVDIGTGKNGFLYKKELIGFQQFIDAPDSIPPQINQIITKGQSIVVQVVKEATGTKGARLTEMVTYSGKHLVYMPYAGYIAVSKKVAEPDRTHWRELGAELVKDNEGIILRTIVEKADEDTVREELSWLRLQHKELLEKLKTTPQVPTVLFNQSSLVQRIYFDYFSDGKTEVVVDNREDFQRFEKLGGTKVRQDIDLYQGRENIFQAFQVEKQLEKALHRKVWLKNGGFLVIDRTEAMTVIDVNTGKFTGKENLQDTVLKTNLDAARSVAEQLRLRDIGGIILIDFIDMKEESHKEQVLGLLKKELKKDRTLTNVGGFTQFGLLEMTRKKSRKSLDELLEEPCQICHGVGRISSKMSVLAELERDLIALKNSMGDAILVETTKSIGELLLEQDKLKLRSMETDIQKTIYLYMIPDFYEGNAHQCSIRIVGEKDEIKEIWLKRSQGI